eukprot:CFRG7071T1
MLFSRIVLFVCALLIASVFAGESRGFGDEISWFNDLKEAQVEASNSGKPMVVLIHKTWCGACKNLKKTMSTSTELVNAAKDYVMVNLEDEEEPKGTEYKPDGGYVPRLFFADSTGVVKPDLKVIGGNPKYGYFYSSADAVVNSMKSYKDKFAHTTSSAHDEV